MFTLDNFVSSLSVRSFHTNDMLACDCECAAVCLQCWVRVVCEMDRPVIGHT